MGTRVGVGGGNVGWGVDAHRRPHIAQEHRDHFGRIRSLRHGSPHRRGELGLRGKQQRMMSSVLGTRQLAEAETGVKRGRGIGARARVLNNGEGRLRRQRYRTGRWFTATPQSRWRARRRTRQFPGCPGTSARRCMCASLRSLLGLPSIARDLGQKQARESVLIREPEVRG